MKKLFLLLLLFCQSAAFAKDYRVATIPDFEVALQQVRPGESIIWMNGTYTDLKIDFTPKTNGSKESKIYLKAETPGKVMLKGASQLFMGGNHLQVEGFLFTGTSTLGERDDVISFRSRKNVSANYCRVTGCAFNDYSPADANINNDWIIIYGTHNEVDHCYLKGKTNLGPYLVVAYDKPKDFVDGSDACLSTYHSIHHNYFGYRTMPGDNGGECIRTGDSKTSMTKGFNIFEYNYFEKEENEPEVISNKSCDNIYRFNTLYGNDGALVLRHGNRCVVYGNYINGKTGRGNSGGIRIIGEDHVVFNNYIENTEGGNKSLKAPITIMGGIPASPINGYFAGHNAVVCFNTVVNAVGPVIHAGAYAKTKEPIAPENIVVAQNTIINPQGKNPVALKEESNVSFKLFSGNIYTGGLTLIRKGLRELEEAQLNYRNGFWYRKESADKTLVELIIAKTKVHKLNLTAAAITVFNPAWIVTKKDVGVN